MRGSAKGLRGLFVKGPADSTYLLLVLLLLAMGLLMLFSASYPSALYEEGDAAFYLKRQALFAAFGLFLMFFVSKLDYHLFKRAAEWLMLLAIFLLVLVLAVGKVRNNARRWFIIGPLSFQPSELAKLAVIVYFSATIAGKKEQMRTFRSGVLPYLLILCILSFLMLRQPHLSGTILLCGTGTALMFVGGIRYRWVILGAGLLLGGTQLFTAGILRYGQGRIATWHDPFSDALGDGYQLAQSQIAIGSGGLFGVGLGRGMQKFLYLPEEHNDFIFAVVCEEVGFVGALLVLLVFALLIIRGYQIARAAPDRFGSLLVVGVTTLVALQVFLNVAVVTGLLPTTGISLPFFSYGGSALVLLLVEMGVVLSVSRQVR